MATVDQANRTRDGHGRYRRTINGVDRDVRAAILHSQGKTYDEIAAQLGYADKGTAYRGVQKALERRLQNEMLQVAREKRLLELDELRAALWVVILDPPPLTDRTGRVVHDDDGHVVPDTKVQVEAASAVIRASERTSRLQGLDAPRRVHTSIEAMISAIPPADLRAYIEQRRAELQADDRRRADEVVRQPIEERRRALQQALADLDAEAQQLAIPATVEPAESAA